jgi:hypothetical protein
MKEKNQIAAALGRLGRGKPKTFSKAEIRRRTARIRSFNRARKAQKLAQSISV